MAKIRTFCISLLLIQSFRFISALTPSRMYVWFKYYTRPDPALPLELDRMRGMSRRGGELVRIGSWYIEIESNLLYEIVGIFVAVASKN